MNKFKVGVSNWELTFENNQIIYFKTIIREVVEMYADGTTRINLKNASFDEKFIDIFKEGALLSNISQTFDLRNPVGESADIITYNYLNMTIDRIAIVSSSDTVATVNVVFKSK